MKKRLLSVLLVLLMFVSCFTMTGCGEETEEEVQTVRVGTTLTLWLPAAKGAEVDDEAVVNVENAINEFTQKNFTTAIKLKVFPAEDYDSIVLSKIYQIKAAEDAAAAAEAAARKAKREAKKNGTSTTAADTENTETVADTDETSEGGDLAIDVETTNPEDYILPDDENGKKVYDYEYENAYLNASLFTSYPSVESNQFDIFLIHGYDEFKLLNNDILLSDLTSNYENQSKTLKSYINGSFLKGALYDNSLYCIPNNRAAGEIGVMLINKSVCEQLYYDPAQFDSVDKLFTYDDSGISFIEDVKNSLPNVTPVAGNYTPSNIKYFNETDDGSFSLLSALVSSEITTFDSFGFTNIFKNTNFVNAYKLEKRINDIVTPVDFDSAGEFAVGFFKGTYDEIEQFEDDYQVVTLQKPQLTADDVFDSAFAVSYYTKNVDRAMEIITAINCNTELRTILQYGQEGVHWRYDVEDPNVIRILSDKYKMDLKETGNSFITYPGPGIPISAWEDAKASNVELYLPYTYGFNYVTENTAPLLKELTEKSKEIYDRIQAMSADEFNNSLESLRNEVDGLECFQKLSYVFGTSTELDEKMVPEESLHWLFMDFATNDRGW